MNIRKYILQVRSELGFRTIPEQKVDEALDQAVSQMKVRNVAQLLELYTRVCDQTRQEAVALRVWLDKVLQGEIKATQVETNQAFNRLQDRELVVSIVSRLIDYIWRRPQTLEGAKNTLELLHKTPPGGGGNSSSRVAVEARTRHSLRALGYDKEGHSEVLTSVKAEEGGCGSRIKVEEVGSIHMDRQLVTVRPEQISTEQRIKDMLWPYNDELDKEDMILVNAQLHELLQRNLRWLYETDGLLRYICYRSARARLDMAFSRDCHEVPPKEALYLHFRVNSDRLEKQYQSQIEVQPREDHVDCRNEAICMMLCKIKQDLRWDSKEDKILVVDHQPFTMDFAARALINALRDMRKRSILYGRGGFEKVWSNVYLEDVYDRVSVPAVGTRLRVILTNHSRNARRVDVVIITDRKVVPHVINFEDKTETMNKVIEQGFKSVTAVQVRIDIKGKWPVRVSIDVIHRIQ
jgi:hypothetical protein